MRGQYLVMSCVVEARHGKRSWNLNGRDGCKGNSWGRREIGKCGGHRDRETSGVNIIYLR